jgi:hypothetical protein
MARQKDPQFICKKGHARVPENIYVHSFERCLCCAREAVQASRDARKVKQ